MTLIASEHLLSVKHLKRDDIIPFYRHMILNNAPDAEVKRVNALILSKWKPSGLLYIKEKAWKGLEYKCQ